MGEKTFTIFDKLELGITLSENEMDGLLWDNKMVYEEVLSERSLQNETLTVVEDRNGTLWAIEWLQGKTERTEHEFPKQPYKVRLEEKEVTITETTVIPI